MFSWLPEMLMWSSAFGSAFHQRDIPLLIDPNFDQLPLVARHIYLCFQARKSDESHLAPYPGLQILLIDKVLLPCLTWSALNCETCADVDHYETITHRLMTVDQSFVADRLHTV